MKYPILKELRKYSVIRLPVNPGILKLVNAMMPIVQKSRPLDSSLQRQSILLPNCPAELLMPKGVVRPSLLIYYHGGAFLMKAAAYHKNLAQTYAKEAGCAVLFVDYRLSPKHGFPLPAEDCFDAYQWAVRQDFSRIVLGGDSAGANLSLAVIQMAHREGLPLPAAQMLIYPVCVARMQTGSMKRFTDTPLWNSRLNGEMYRLYAEPLERHDPLISPMEAADLSFLPPTYIETAEYDCLHDEGIALAARLNGEGVSITLNETVGTIHGYDIAEMSPYVKEQVQKRVRFLSGITNI